MSTTYKVLIAILVAILIGVGGFFAWKTYQNNKTPQISNQEPTNNTPQEVKNTFASTTMGIVINYPMGYTPDPNYANTSFPNKPIHGVKFTIPQTMATGTNLSTDTGLSVEQLPRAKKCTGDIYLFENVKAHEVTENGVTYSVASSTGAAAGNRYEETVYALTNSSPCTALRYFIHYGVIENYPQGSVKEFNKDALLSDFDDIRSSLVLNQVATSTH